MAPPQHLPWLSARRGRALLIAVAISVVAADATGDDLQYFASVNYQPQWPGKPYKLVCPRDTPQSTCRRLVADPSCSEPESDTEQVLNSFLLDCTDCLYVDIGCNIGYFALQAAALGARVDCYEPNPAYTAASKMSAALNGFADRMRVHTAAVLPERHGTDTLTFSHSYSPCQIGSVATSRLVLANGDGGFKAPTVWIDHILLGKHVGLLKIDIDSIEGALLHRVVRMLRGGQTNITTIVAELGDNTNTVKWFDCRANSSLCGPAQDMRGGSFRDIWLLQHELGYDVYRLNIHTGREIFDWRGMNVNGRMVDRKPGLEDMYGVRSMRKLEKVRSDTPFSAYPEFLSSGVSLLFTRVQLAEISKHHVLDTSYALNIQGSAYRTPSQNLLNHGNPLWPE